MKQFKQLLLFKNDTIGKMFFPDGISFNSTSLIPSIIHGRSIAIKVDKYKWILVKGGGWNYDGPVVYRSKKDPELVFGLNPTSAAKRELAVSKEIEKISNEFPKVLYYKRFADYEMPKEFDFLKTICYSNGRLVDPGLTYTEVKCPFRVLDIAYQTNDEKEKIINFCCEYWGIDSKDYIKKFAFELGRHVGILHKNNFINDTLEYSNVTMLAEIVDYELVTAPGIPLEDGSDYTGIIPNERREKELLYGAEVVLQLSALLYNQLSLYESYKMFIDGYYLENKSFVDQNKEIQAILNKEKYIL